MSMAEFFKWRRHPFADTRSLNPPFLSGLETKHLHHTLSLLSLAKSLAFIGPSGVGKSTFVQHLIRQLDPKHYLPVFLAYAGLKRSGIHRALADILGVDTSGRQVPLLVKLQKFLQQQAPQSHTGFPVLIIDDAHMMERETLLDCCSLLTMPLQGTASAALILVGDHQLTKTLQLHIMTPIRSRITATFAFQPLSDTDAKALILHRLEQANAPKDLFEPQALQLLTNSAGGSRRQLMNLATLALEEAFVQKEHTISSQLLLQTPFFDTTFQEDPS